MTTLSAIIVVTFTSGIFAGLALGGVASRRIGEARLSDIVGFGAIAALTAGMTAFFVFDPS